MTELVVVIPFKAKDRLQIIEKRDLCIGIVTTNHQHYAVRKNEHIKKPGQPKRMIRCRQNHKANDCRSNFQDPRQVVLWGYTGPNQDGKEGDKPGRFHCPAPVKIED